MRALVNRPLFAKMVNEGLQVCSRPTAWSTVVILTAPLELHSDVVKPA